MHMGTPQIRGSPTLRHWGVYAILSWGEGGRVWDVKGKEDNSQDDKKSKYLENQCLPCPAEKIFWCKKLSLVIVVFLIQAPCLNCFRQLKERLKKILPHSVRPLFHSGQNSPHAKITYFRITCSASPHSHYEMTMKWQNREFHHG